MDQTFAHYVETCRRRGFSDSAIKETLLNGGWLSDQVEDLFSQAGPTPLSSPVPNPAAAPAARRSPGRTLGPIGLVMVAVLALGGATVTAAEYGYLPAVSRLYRKTALPLLWKGTNANAGLTLFKTFASTAQTGDITEDGKVTLTVSVADASRSASLDKLPGLAAIFSKKGSRAYASEPADKNQVLLGDAAAVDTAAAAPDYSKLFPVSVSLTTEWEADQGHDVDMSLSLDLKDLIAKLGVADPSALQSFATLAPSVSVAGRVLPGSKAYFLKSSLIPYLTPADKDKWLAFVLPDAEASDLLNPSGTQQKLSSQETALLQDVLNRSVTDGGIRRKDGQPQAVYHVALTPEIFKALAAVPAYRSFKSDLEEYAAEKMELAGDLAVEPQSGRFLSFVGTLKTVDPSANVALRFDVNISTRYAFDHVIARPAAGETVAGSGADYLQRAFEGEIDTWLGTASADSAPASTSSSNMNAARQSDMVELGKALESYQADHPEAGLPSTGGKTQRLDDANNALAQSAAFLKYLPASVSFPLRDPEPDTYYYGYSSDGATYRLTAVQTDASDSDKVTAIYSVSHGVTTLTPYTPAQ